MAAADKTIQAILKLKKMLLKDAKDLMTPKPKASGKK